MTQFQPPKGMQDFYPEERMVQRTVFDSLSRTARSFSFQEVDVPVVESIALLTAKSGEEIKQQIFVLEKKGTEELALRPEFTPGFARMFVAKQRELVKPVKWFAINKAWRYEAPQKGRAREFFQLNAELYGSDKPEADAEIILLAINCLKNLGLKDNDFVVRINNRKLLSGLLSNMISDDKTEAAMRLIDKSSKLTEQEFELEAGKEKFTTQETN
ncbi:ATP phosphoribosyltransferase regulatory subunit [Candidatus Woesearchaeota archaeon]|nr:ATP phosphoribosyltransferase regulatory subunit [Candidatus Woesearchaeota archaeon]